QPAAGEFTAVFVVVVCMKGVESAVEGDVPIGIAVTDRMQVQLRAVGPATDDGAGAKHGHTAAITTFDIVIAVAGGNVQPPLIADRQTGNLVMVNTTESLRDDLWLGLRLVRRPIENVRELPAADRAAT